MTRAMVAIGVLAALGLGLAYFIGDGPDDGAVEPAGAHGEAPNATGPVPVPGASLAPLQRRGRLLGPSGQGVAGMDVGMLSRPPGLGGPFQDAGNFLARATTDEGGRFTLTAVAPGEFWLSALVSSGGVALVGAPVAARFAQEPDAAEVTLQLIPAREISGQLALDGAPGVNPDAVRVLAIGERSGQSAAARLEADGSFVLRSLFDDTYFVTASCPGAVAPSVHGVAAGAQDVRLALEPFGALRVVIEGGEPQGLRIECSPEGGNPAQLARLAFVGRSPQLLLPGSYTIAAYTQTQFGLTSVDGIGTATAPREVSLQLGPAGGLEVENAAPNARILLVEWGGRLARAQAIAHCGHTIMPVPPGVLVVREHMLDGALVRTHTVTVPAGGRAPLRLDP